MRPLEHRDELMEFQTALPEIYADPLTFIGTSIGPIEVQVKMEHMRKPIRISLQAPL